MHNNAPADCRCCHGRPVVGYFGLCRACTDAVDRFIALRRDNLRKQAGRP